MINKLNTRKSREPLPSFTRDFREVPIKYLFKYKPFNEYLFDSVVSREIYFSRPTELNDPFEFRQNWWSCDDTPSSIYKFKKFLDDGGSVDRVFCMTRNPNNCLMWSHYSNSHQGVCIGYEETEFSKFKTQKIRYVNTMPDKINNNVIHTKGKIWSYEKEVRIFSENKFEKATPSMIIFGAQTTIANMIKIVNAVKSYKIHYYYVSDIDSDFSLRLSKITKKQIVSGDVISIFPFYRNNLRKTNLRKTNFFGRLNRF